MVVLPKLGNILKGVSPGRAWPGSFPASLVLISFVQSVPFPTITIMLSFSFSTVVVFQLDTCVIRLRLFNPSLLRLLRSPRGLVVKPKIS